MARTRKTTQATVNGNTMEAEILRALDGPRAPKPESGADESEAGTSGPPSAENSGSTDSSSPRLQASETGGKKRGRKPKARMKLEIPAEVVTILADAPYLGTEALLMRFGKRQANFPQPVMRMSRTAFCAWWDTLEIEAHPMLVYAIAVAGACAWGVATSTKLTPEELQAVAQAKAAEVAEQARKMGVVINAPDPANAPTAPGVGSSSASAPAAPSA